MGRHLVSHFMTIAANITTPLVLLLAAGCRHVDALPSPPVMHSIPLLWNFDDGLGGWAQSTPMEMGVEVDAINGFLQGIMLPSAQITEAFVDSPELRVEIDADDRDYLVLRMKYFGQCERATLALERNPQETAVEPGIRRERRAFHDPVLIPFQPHTSSFGDDLYYFPIWRYTTGTIHRVRLYPCTKAPETVLPGSGHTFQIDWVAFAKAPVVTKVRGCIDKYYDADGLDSNATMNCQEHIQKTNGFHHSSAFECFPMELPIAGTYNCLRGGGQRITISGKHFGAADAIVTIDGVECTDVVHVIPETELECTLPGVSRQWASDPQFPSLVRVHNGRLQALVDEVPLLSYVAPVRAMAAPIISNVAAHALDVNWLPPGNVWESMTVTGYRVEWKRCNDIFNPKDSFVVGNVTSTTITSLDPMTTYQARVLALSEDYRLRQQWQDIDLYGRRRVLPSGAVLGRTTPLSECVSTLEYDFHFPSFTAHSLTNVSSSSSPLTSATLGPTGDVGDQGHFGLYVNGDTNVENCNASVSCCDSFVRSEITGNAVDGSCTYTCSVTERRVATFINNRTVRTISTNAAEALPFPAKVVRSVSDASSSNTAPPTAACGPSLRLTSSASFLSGSAWYPRQMNVREGFETTFAFRIGNPSTFCQIMDNVHTRCRSRGGDGFAFVVQNDAAIALGAAGMELGYGGLRNALAIEFDTWFNYEQSDLYENHVGVHISPGKHQAIHSHYTYSLGATTAVPDLTDGIHTVRITYDPNFDEQVLMTESFMASTQAAQFFRAGDWHSGVGVLSIYLDDLNSAVLTVPVRLETTLELAHGRAWVGFTGATGATAYQTQDILSWKFRSRRRNIKGSCTTATTVTGESTVMFKDPVGIMR